MQRSVTLISMSNTAAATAAPTVYGQLVVGDRVRLTNEVGRWLVQDVRDSEWSDDAGTLVEVDILDTDSGERRTIRRPVNFPIWAP